MNDSLPTVWDADPHTFAKHDILRGYLNAWIPIMARHTQKRGTQEHLLVVEGFAGPGIYKRGEPGSPVVAIKTVLEHSQKLPIPIKFLFVEKDPDRFRSLENVISQHRATAIQSGRVSEIQVRTGDCETILTEFLDYYAKQNQPLGPAFFFLDQFGYSDVSMRLVTRIMGLPVCEVFTYLNWGHMSRFLTDPTKWGAITTAYGGEEWKQALNLPSDKRAAFMLKTYKLALRGKASARYVWHFAMCDSDSKLIYWLFFCTNSLDGLRYMKRAMLRVDDTGCFRFSDRDNPEQGILFREYDDSLLAEELHRHFAGGTASVATVEELVLTETANINYKAALKLLEKAGKLEMLKPPPKRRVGTFPDDTARLRFNVME